MAPGLRFSICLVNPIHAIQQFPRPLLLEMAAHTCCVFVTPYPHPPKLIPGFRLLIAALNVAAVKPCVFHLSLSQLPVGRIFSEEGAIAQKTGDIASMITVTQ